MKIQTVFVITFMVTFNWINQPLFAQNVDYQKIKSQFNNPPQSAKPKVYWWILNGNLDTIRAKQELQAMKEAGIGGFDFFEIGAPRDTMIPGGPAFMSDESVDLIEFAVKEAGKLGLTMGLNLASSWNAGGSWVEPKHGGKSLYRANTTVAGNGTEQNIKVPFPDISFPKDMLIGHSKEPMITMRGNGKPVYYEEIALLALPAAAEKNQLDTSQIIDVTPFFNPENDMLKWKAPEGEWEIHRYVCSNSGQQVVLPSPQSAGLVIDHFDSTAVETHLMYFINKLQPVLGDFRETALKSFYLASYEARGFVWTSSLSEEFKNINGYSIKKFIPSFFSQEVFSKETNEMIDIDFKKTLSELMINNLYRKSQEICSQYGLQINCEAGGPGYPLYNGPAEPLKALGALDIPRGEFWVNHSRYYKDTNGIDSIDILNVVKEVAAASHIYEKGIVEEEAFTSFQHWQAGPFDIKPEGDRAFCEGMNRVVFHGFSHNITGSGFPGFVYHAGTHINTKRAWWSKVKPFISYMARLSAVFQATDFVADAVWYYGDKIPNSATAKNTHFSVGAGYDYEVINTDILLNNLSVINGKLQLTNGAEFSVLALENEERINPKVLLKVKELAEQGAKITGAKPKGISEIKNSPLTKSEGKKIIDELWKNSSPATFQPNENGKIYAGISSKDILQKLDIPSDLDYQDKETWLIDYIHYQKGETDFYFLRNTTPEWISRDIGFRLQNSVPEIWNPVSGEIMPVTIFEQKGQYIRLPLTLPPYGSQLVAFRKGSASGQFTSVQKTGQHPPKMEFTPEGIHFLEDEDIILQKQQEKTTVSNILKSHEIKGEWEVSFSDNWGAPSNETFPELVSWTESENEGIRYFSGTGTYKKSFDFDWTDTENKKIYLDLGDVQKIAEVWLNGERLGITWAKPHRFDVTEIIQSEKNNLLVEVANVWSNRLKGDAVTGANFTNTNIRHTIIPSEGIHTGDQKRYPWKEVPLIESGLLGPVKISAIKLIGIE